MQKRINNTMRKRIIVLAISSCLTPMTLPAADDQQQIYNAKSAKWLRTEISCNRFGHLDFWRTQRGNMLRILHHEKSTPKDSYGDSFLKSACFHDDAEIVQACIMSWGSGSELHKRMLNFTRSLQIADYLAECTQNAEGSFWSPHHWLYAEAPLLDKFCRVNDINERDMIGGTHFNYFLQHIRTEPFNDFLQHIRAEPYAFSKTCIYLAHGADHMQGQMPLELLARENPDLWQQIKDLTPEQIRKIAQGAVDDDPKEHARAERLTQLRIYLGAHLLPELTATVVDYGGAFTPLPPFE